MQIVPDEWLLDCLRPDNDCYSQSGQFLDLVEKRRDQIVIREHSPFKKKLSKYAEIYPLEFKRLWLMLVDSEKAIRVDEENIHKLPHDIDSVVPNDDKYLIELLFSTDDKILVTTDAPLKNRIKDKNDFKVFLYNEFMQLYKSN